MRVFAENWKPKQEMKISIKLKKSVINSTFFHRMSLVSVYNWYRQRQENTNRNLTIVFLCKI